MSAILFAFCAIQALGVVLQFFGISWQSIRTGRRASRVNRKSRVYSMWTGILATGSFTAAGAGFYLQLHRNHIIAFWVVLGVLSLLALVSWILVLRSSFQGDSQPALGAEPEAIFSPLQIEAFQLAKHLREFMANFEPIPAVDPSQMSRGEVFDTVFDKRIPWRKKLTSSYALHFAPKAKTLMHRFGEQGVSADQLVHFTEKIGSEQQIPTLQARLVCLAHSIDGIHLKQDEGK